MEVAKVLEVGFFVNGCGHLHFPPIALSFLKTHNHSQIDLGETAEAITALIAYALFLPLQGYKNVT